MNEASETLDEALVRLDGVEFTYPGMDEPVVSHIDLTLDRGEAVAVVD